MANDAEWTSDEIIAWLGTLGIGAGLDVDIEAVVSGPYIPDMPHRVAVITPIAGAGETLNGLGDISGFQLLVRGDPNDPPSAERLARGADRAIRFSPFPMDVAGGLLRLARVMRSGGGPAVLAMEDDADRVSLTCNYLTEILRY